MTQKYIGFQKGKIRKLLNLSSVALYFDIENGDLYQIGIDENPQWETRFNVLDRDGRTYENDLFDKLLDKKDAKAVMSFLYEIINRQTRELNSRKRKK